MKRPALRLVAAALLIVVAAACRESALASDEDRNANVALCAAAHGVPQILLAYHHQKIDRETAIARLGHVRHVIDENASGRYAAHLHDVAAAVHVFQIVTMNRGDSGDAYRDLRTVRESLPHCPTPAVVPRSTPHGVTSG